MTQIVKPKPPSNLRVVGLFAGIGGLELGLRSSGGHIVAASEIWDPARRVLSAQFPAVELLGDVASVKRLPHHDLLAAGFPCNDLSSAGSKAGIGGEKSKLVEHVFRLAAISRPEWILLENVPNLLRLHQGAAMNLIVRSLEDLGYSWAYRIVDSRFTGVPQRRLRVVILASLNQRPEQALLAADQGTPEDGLFRSDAYGFYWTEGRGGLGWAEDALPTLKGGSTIGINSAPAVWIPDASVGSKIVIPSVGDGEKLQGFTPGWTEPAVAGRMNHRWKLVGNAVTVGVADWVGREIRDIGERSVDGERQAKPTGSWPNAGWGAQGVFWSSPASAWPERSQYQHLLDVLDLDEAVPLSHRATCGFLSRLDRSRLSLQPTFLRDVEEHVRKGRAPLGAARTRNSVDLAALASSKKPVRTDSMALRRALFARGLRYRVAARPTTTISARFDVVHRPSRVAIDVRRCAAPDCCSSQNENVLMSDALRKKYDRMTSQDLTNVDVLKSNNWHREVVWAHEDSAIAAERLLSLIEDRRR